MAKKKRFQELEEVDREALLLKFLVVIQDIFGECQTTKMQDMFGGVSLWVYLPPVPSSKTPVDAYIQRTFAEESMEIAAKLLPQMRTNFARELAPKISSAIDDLFHEVLSPLYDATGRKWGEEVYRSKWDGKEVQHIYIGTRELKDGQVIRHRKQAKHGRPPQWTKARLEKEVRRASKKLFKQGIKLTLANMVIEINHQRQGSNPLTENALKHLLGHYQVIWKDIKSALIGRS